MTDTNSVTLINLTTNTDSKYDNRYLLEYSKPVKNMKQPDRDDDDIFIIQASSL